MASKYDINDYLKDNPELQKEVAEELIKNLQNKNNNEMLRLLLTLIAIPEWKEDLNKILDKGLQEVE